MSAVRQNPVDFPVPEPVRLRWSPVSYTGEPVAEATLAAVFESARWAASSFNEQPWRFVVARREQASRFEAMLGCLVDANREWARHAGALIIVCTMNRFSHNGKANAHGWFDTGQATAQLMLGAVHHGLHCRSMGGFSAEAARENFSIGPEADPICVVAIGKLGDGSLLAPETAARDDSARTRRPLDELVFEDRFGQPAGFLGD